MTATDSQCALVVAGRGVTIKASNDGLSWLPICDHHGCPTSVPSLFRFTHYLISPHPGRHGNHPEPHAGGAAQNGGPATGGRVPPLPARLRLRPPVTPAPGGGAISATRKVCVLPSRTALATHTGRGGTGMDSGRSRSARSGTSTPGSTAVTPGTPPSYACRTPGSRTPGSHTPKSFSVLQEKKIAVIRTPPKSPSSVQRQLKVINQPLPDLTHVKSKIGSTSNLKHQPKGGQYVRPSRTRRQHSTGTRLLFFYFPAWLQIQIVSERADFSHVQSKCGSKNNLRHSPRGGHVMIPSVKLDFSHVQAKCGSLDKIQHAAGGGNIESHKLMFREEAKARVDHGAEIVTTHSPCGEPGGTSPRLCSAGSMLASPQLATLAQDVTAALAKQGL
uniref:Microtubule-associated protein n=1 Tax=Gadus morhua TaxID=8049 RepID=A0A8C5CLV9_GADMO